MQALASDGEFSYLDYTTTAPSMNVAWYVGGVMAVNEEMTGCDFNGDGVVNIADGQTLLDYATGVVTTLNDKDNADVDGDGDIDSHDAYVFLKNLSTTSATLPAGGAVEILVKFDIPAESDHARAESDHTRAQNDHTTAAADHTTAVADHTTAVDDHEQVQAMNCGLIGLAVDDGELILTQNAETGTVESGTITEDGDLEIVFNVSPNKNHYEHGNKQDYTWPASALQGGMGCWHHL